MLHVAVVLHELDNLLSRNVIWNRMGKDELFNSGWLLIEEGVVHQSEG